MYVLVGIGQGKVQKKRLMCTFVFMHINEYICSAVQYVYYIYSSTVQYVYYFKIIHFP